MEISAVLRALGALAQASRLAIFRELVRRGEAGLPAGEIAARLSLPGPTLSFHLRELREAGLVSCRRAGRSLIYAADLATLRGVASYLLESCGAEAAWGRADRAPKASGRTERERHA